MEPTDKTFTDKGIDNLKAKEKQYVRRERDGFAIRILPKKGDPKGTKIWLFIYTIAGKRRQMNLGEYPIISLADARKRLTAARKTLHDGKDPQEVGFEWHRNPERDRKEAARIAEEDLKNPTIKTLAKDYLEFHAKRKKRESSWKEDERLLNKDVLPIWGDRKVKDITRRDVKNLLESVVGRGAALSANIKKLVSVMFSYAVEEEMRESNPCFRLPLAAPVKRRERRLSQQETFDLLNTELPKAGMSDEAKRILQVLLFTAQRVSEVAGMHRREIDGRWWTIPAERAKNGRTHRVYLTDTVLELIGNKEGYIFPTPIGKRLVPMGENGVSYAVRRNIKNYTPRRPIKGDVICMVKVPEEKQMDIAHFTPHDLRRTATTFMAMAKVSREYRERVTNHALEKLDAIYNLYDYDEEKQVALEKLEQTLKDIIAGKFKDQTEEEAAAKATEAEVSN